MSYFLIGPTVKIAPGVGGHGHRFGGKPLHSFRGDQGSKTTVHCLYLLDCEDPALPTVLEGLRWLPLY